jgi:hypothetical protein|tara:strand:- start:2034 stop:2828 length:795 start_codon:yes stop_codon:yes gene_type:complete
MAIAINGSGTMTGISVGGLPDGIVDAGTLATNSVDSAELVSGSVDSAHLAGSIDATKLADGTVTSTELQYINSLSSNAQTQISAAGGGWEYLSTSTFSAVSSVDITSADGISQANHAVIACYFENVFPNTSSQSIHMRYSEDNGSSFSTASDYNFAGSGHDDAGTALNWNGGAATSIQLSAAVQGASNAYGVWGWLYFTMTASTAEGVATTWQFQGRDTGNDFWVASGAGNERASGGGDWDAFQFLSSSGNITGDIHVYGIKSS